MFLLHIPGLLLLSLTGTPFSNNWYVSTGGFPSAEQLTVTTEPWHTVELLTVKLNFSGLSVRFKSEMERHISLHCKRHSVFSEIVGQNVLFYKLQMFTTIPALGKTVTVRDCVNLWQLVTCLILLITCRHVTCLSHHSVRFISDRQSIHNSQFKVVRQFFLDYIANKTEILTL